MDMLRTEATPENLEQWKALWLKWHERLRPNRKSGAELVQLLQKRFPLREIPGKAAALVVRENILRNEVFSSRLKAGESPLPRCFLVQNRGAGAALYASRAKDEREGEIFIGIDLVTGYFCVEGSERLWDECLALRGLDEDDLKNPFLVAQYVEAAGLERPAKPPANCDGPSRI
jgi:hypothetical protein